VDEAVAAVTSPRTSRRRLAARPPSFFLVEPEASGRPASDAPAEAPAYVFDTWLGDDLVRAHPGLLVTTAVKTALGKLPQRTGFEAVPARVVGSRFFRQHSPGQRLPRFWAIRVFGQPGRDDLGITAAGGLVVSRRALDVLLDFRIGRAVLAKYTPGAPTPAGR
jgi:hypothetical protein